MAQQSAKLIQKMYKKVCNLEKVGGIFEYLNGLPKLGSTQCRATSAEDFC